MSGLKRDMPIRIVMRLDTRATEQREIHIYNFVLPDLW